MMHGQKNIKLVWICGRNMLVSLGHIILYTKKSSCLFNGSAPISEII